LSAVERIWSVESSYGSARRLCSIVTRWSLIPLPISADDPRWESSWTWLYGRYEGAMRRYVLAILRWATRQPDYSHADDLVHAYLAKAMEKRWLAEQEEPIRVFRAFLQRQLRWFVYSSLRDESAQRRGGGLKIQREGLDQLVADYGDPLLVRLERGWMHTAMDRALAELRRRNANEAALIIELMKRNGDRRDNEYLIRALGLELTPAQFAHKKSRAKKRFAKLLAYELRQTVADDEAFEEEWKVLEPFVPWLEKPEKEDGGNPQGESSGGTGLALVKTT